MVSEDFLCFWEDIIKTDSSFKTVLQGATVGIQFKSPEAGDFSPVSPFSPLHAFLDISGFVDIFYPSSVYVLLFLPFWDFWG